MIVDVKMTVDRVVMMVVKMGHFSLPVVSVDIRMIRI